MNDTMRLRIFITLGAFLAIAIHLFSLVKIDNIVLILIVVMIIPWLQPLIRSVELPGGMKIELQEIKQKLDETNERIAKLFLITMSPTMYENLKKLTDKNGFGVYEMSTGLQRELYHLRDIGYIKVKSVKNIPPSGSNLSDYVEIEPAGAQFVKLREESKDSLAS